MRVLPTNLAQACGSGTGLEWKSDPGTRLSLCAGTAAPDHLDRHWVAAGIQEVQHAGTRFVPQVDLKRLAWCCRPEIRGMPMGQTRHASQVHATVIDDLEDNRHRSRGAAARIGIVDESHALRLGLRFGSRADTNQKSRDAAAKKIQARET